MKRTLAIVTLGIAALAATVAYARPGIGLPRCLINPAMCA